MKFTAAEALKDWIKKNPTGLSFYCDFSSRDSPDVSIPLFVLFRNPWKGVGELVIERHAVLGTLKKNHVEERGGDLGSSRRDLYMMVVGVFQFVFELGQSCGRIYTFLPCSCDCWV